MALGLSPYAGSAFHGPPLVLAGVHVVSSMLRCAAAAVAAVTERHAASQASTPPSAALLAVQPVLGQARGQKLVQCRTQSQALSDTFHAANGSPPLTWAFQTHVRSLRLKL